jgi:hypothetical protein
MAKKSTVKRPPYKKRVKMVAKAGAPNAPRAKSSYPKGKTKKLR